MPQNQVENTIAFVIAAMIAALIAEALSVSGTDSGDRTEPQHSTTNFDYPIYKLSAISGWKIFAGANCQIAGKTNSDSR